VPITHLICRKLIDRSDLLQQLSASEHDADNAALDRIKPSFPRKSTIERPECS
jgi:hypothetical protein